MLAKFSKRFFDLLLASVLLILSSWLMCILFLLVRFFLGSPAIFKQTRIGHEEKPFTLYKFRTMTDSKDKPEAERLTPFGIFLRKSSLDELPQLFNILKGEMSFVGPRPLLVDYLLLYNAEQKRRHSVKPGITGWAQVNGRNAISWQEKFRLDCWYVNHHSFWLDIKIMWLTFLKVLQREGISQAGQATMEKFNGNN